MSFFAEHVRTKSPRRIEIDLNPRGTNHVFAFYLGSEARSLRNVTIDYASFDLALRHLDDARLASIEATAGGGNEDRTRHELIGVDPTQKLSLGLSADQWLGRLTKEQRDFVNCDANRSIRLVGAAGTGKTLSMVIKCLREYQRRVSQPGGYRSLFLTFSQNNVDHINAAVASMDHTNALQEQPPSVLKVCTLQALAHESMKLDLYGVAPISTDGYEGREWQRWLLEDVTHAYRKGDWITRRARCSPRVRDSIEAGKDAKPQRLFIDALLTEFACVVEPQGVRRGAEQRESYLRAQRRPWMPDFSTREDRQVVLDLYDRFRSELREQSCIGADQLTADFLVELGTNRWDQIRSKEGYDAIFVDELHLFNRQERMVPHLLMRDPKSPPVVIMAYDFKQSPRVTFGKPLEEAGPVQLSREMGLGETERFDLKTAFRYTPQIAAMLTWIDQAIPAAGMAEELGNEWIPFSATSGREGGSRPTLTILENTQAVHSLVFPRAERRARFLKDGTSVAVLCLSEQLFERYAYAGAHKEAFVVVSDREQIAALRRAGRRFVFSMPEFVAGMQFDTVYLIEVNDGEVGEGPDFAGRNLQFVSQVYLGASRAEKTLEVYATRERGGVAKCLMHAEEQGAISIVTAEELPDPGTGSH
jgi:hypothetical protein